MAGAGTGSGSARRALSRGARHGYQVAVLVLAGSLLAVWFYARSAGENERELARAGIIAEANDLTELLRQRLLTYELTTRGGVSLFASVEWPSQAQWQAYVAGLRIGERSLGVLGLAYAAYLTPAELTELQLRRRAEGDGLYEVRPHGLRERYGPVVYLGPETPQARKAIGYDLYSEPVRRAAMDAAVIAGDVRLSAPLVLVRDQEQEQPGLLMFAPVYLGGELPVSLSARRATVRGWVYVPFRTADFVRHALEPMQRQVRVRIVDVDSPDGPLYADPDFDRIAAMADAFIHADEQRLYGRTWRLEFTAPPQPLAGLGLSAQQGTLGIGVVLSLLLFAVVWALARTQVRAERLADRMNESWRRSEVRFRAAMEYSTIGKALLDHADRVVEANPALGRILDLPPQALLGKPFDSWFADVAPIPVLPGGAASAVVRATRELRRPDGERRHVQLTYAPVPGEIGSGVARLVQVEDVTDRMRAEARVRELNRTLEARVAGRTRELEQANRELETFAYSVSHDLRAPLRTIEGFGRLLAERCGGMIDDTGRDHLARIRAAAARMDALIEALLAMSRLSRAELRREPLDLSKMASEIVADLRQAEPARAVEVVVEPGLRAHGDADLVRNLLQNLIGNAWKFTAGRRDARIEIGRTSHGDGEGTVCFVRDNGAGFSPEYASKLFRPFQRLHSQEEFAGHGVGLASVKRVVERHGGQVWAEGEPGKGACFRFRLPDAPPERADAA